VMHAAGDENDTDAARLRALTESDLDLNRGAILIRHGNAGKRREVGTDRRAWEQLTPSLQLRATLPVGGLFCVLRGPTCGRAWAPARVRSQLRQTAARAGVRRRFASHQLRHAHAVEMSREGVPLPKRSFA
jgi:integrase